MAKKQNRLPSTWNVFNLRGSPFWQESLGGENGAHPLSLFVGRENELEALESTIYGAAGSSTRQAVAGGPGVGKTTLVKELKARARKRGYLTLDDYVGLQPGETTETLFGRILHMALETVLVNRPATAGNDAVEAARALVWTSREPTGRGGSLSIMGTGASAQAGSAMQRPSDIMLDAPRVMRDLLTLVRSSAAEGLLLHINNLENLSEADAEQAADIFRGLRDPAFMHPGLHVVLVGTTDAVHTIVNTHQQLRTVFDIHLIEPLDTRDVHALLKSRYEHLRADKSAPITPPVDEATVDSLYSLFRGDLRGLLKALDDGVRPSTGLALERTALDSAYKPESDADLGEVRVRPLTEDDIRPVLQNRYAAHLLSLKEQKRVEQLTQWGETNPAKAHTQKSLAKLWGISQGAVSIALSYMVSEGYVVPLPRQGTSPVQYVLSGTSRLIFG